MSTHRSLLQRARDFDEGALAEIYDQYSTKLYRYAMRLLGHEDMAEDCVAETFRRFLQALKNGRGPEEHLQAYLYRIAHNWITDQYRREPPPTLPLEFDLEDGGESDPVERVENSLEAEKARAALKLLTPEQRQVIVLKFLEELDNREVAEALGKPVGAVKALQHRAIKALRRILVMETE